MRKRIGVLCMLIGFLMLVAAFGLIRYNRAEETAAGESAASVAKEIADIVHGEAEEEKHCENAYQVAKFFSERKEIKSVGYPALESDRYHDLQKKYLEKGASGVISIIIDGGKEKAVKFMDNLKLASNVVHVADIRTCVLHPASETHRQLSDEQLKAAGIDAGLIRVSVGLENIEDILEDFRQALDNL